VQIKLALPLRDHRDHAGVVRRGLTSLNQTCSPETKSSTRRCLAAEVLGHGLGDLARTLARDRGIGAAASSRRSHPDLSVADGLAEVRVDLAVRSARRT